MLELLYLNNNKIAAIPAEIGYVKRKKGITEFLLTFDRKLQRLQQLTLCGNQIKSLPESMKEMKTLSFIGLSENPGFPQITEPSMTFDELLAKGVFQ